MQRIKSSNWVIPERNSWLGKVEQQRENKYVLATQQRCHATSEHSAFQNIGKHHSKKLRIQIPKHKTPPTIYENLSGGLNSTDGNLEDLRRYFVRKDAQDTLGEEKKEYLNSPQEFEEEGEKLGEMILNPNGQEFFDKYKYSPISPNQFEFGFLSPNCVEEKAKSISVIHKRLDSKDNLQGSEHEDSLSKDAKIYGEFFREMEEPGVSGEHVHESLQEELLSNLSHNSNNSLPDIDNSEENAKINPPKEFEAKNSRIYDDSMCIFPGDESQRPSLHSMYDSHQLVKNAMSASQCSLMSNYLFTPSEHGTNPQTPFSPSYQNYSTPKHYQSNQNLNKVLQSNTIGPYTGRPQVLYIYIYIYIYRQQVHLILANFLVDQTILETMTLSLSLQ